jgi:hypothetical protein
MTIEKSGGSLKGFIQHTVSDSRLLFGRLYIDLLPRRQIQKQHTQHPINNEQPLEF